MRKLLRFGLWLGLACAVLPIPSAAAQPGGVGGPPKSGPRQAGPAAIRTRITDLPLQKALDESRRSGRLLLVVMSNNPAQQRQNLAVWDNAGLAAWVERYAIVAHVTDRATIKQLTDAGVRAGGPEQPILFKAGLQHRLFGSDLKNNASRIKGARPAPAGAKPEPGGDTSIRLLMRLVWTRAHLMREDAMYRQQQAALERVESPAPMAPLFTTEAPGVAKVDDLPDGGDVLARLEEARAASKDAAGRPRAIGLYTWLWERAEAVDPRSAPVVRYLVSAEMHALGQADEAARARFRALRDAGLARVAWMPPMELGRWLMLGRVVDEHLPAFEFLDLSLNDADARLVMPASDRFAWELLLPRLAWLSPIDLPSTGGDPVGYIDRLVRRAGELRWPARWSDDERSAAGSLLRTHALHEACRMYAALLATDRDADAAKVADAAGRLLERGEERPWLITAALALRQPRSVHLEWLKDRADPASVRLRTRVEAGLVRGG